MNSWLEARRACARDVNPRRWRRRTRRRGLGARPARSCARGGAECAARAVGYVEPPRRSRARDASSRSALAEGGSVPALCFRCRRRTSHVTDATSDDERVLAPMQAAPRSLLRRARGDAPRTLSPPSILGPAAAAGRRAARLASEGKAARVPSARARARTRRLAADGGPPRHSDEQGAACRRCRRWHGNERAALHIWATRSFKRRVSLGSSDGRRRRSCNAAVAQRGIAGRRRARDGRRGCGRTMRRKPRPHTARAARALAARRSDRRALRRVAAAMVHRALRRAVLASWADGAARRRAARAIDDSGAAAACCSRCAAVPRRRRRRAREGWRLRLAAIRHRNPPPDAASLATRRREPPAPDNAGRRRALSRGLPRGRAGGAAPRLAREGGGLVATIGRDHRSAAPRADLAHLPAHARAPQSPRATRREVAARSSAALPRARRRALARTVRRARVRRLMSSAAAAMQAGRGDGPRAILGRCP